jgi:hypothetical protein
VVIPKAMRAQLGIAPGDGSSSRSRMTPFGSRRDARSSLRGQFAGLALTDALEADHRAESGCWSIASTRGPILARPLVRSEPPRSGPGHGKKARLAVLPIDRASTPLGVIGQRR